MEENLLECLAVGDIQTNCWIYSKNDFCALIDPGDDAPVIIAFLKKKNISPDCILLTHGHLDHLAALPELADFFASENKRPLIAIHKDDACYLGKESYSHHLDCMSVAMGSVSGGEEFIKNFWKPMPDPDKLLSEGDEIGPFKVLHLPGHTPGSVGFYDEEAGVLFSGDTLFCRGIGRADLPGGDEALLAQSLKRLFAMDKNITVCPGHGPVTTIGREAEFG